MRYDVLLKAMANKLGANLDTPAAWPPRLKNLCYALEAYRRHCSCADVPTVGPELGNRFQEMRNAFLGQLAADDLSSQSIRDKKSLLQRWADLQDELSGANEVSQVAARNAFRDALGEILVSKGVTIEGLGQATSIAPGSIASWISSGNLPSRRSVAGVQRIEDFAGRPRGSLVSLFAKVTRSAPAPQTGVVSEYRQRQRDLRKLPQYGRSNAEFAKELHDEFKGLVAFKTTAVIRGRKGRWTVRPVAEFQPHSVTAVTSITTATGETKVSPSAGIMWETLKAYFSFVAAPPPVGVGQPIESLRLAHLLNVDWVERFIAFSSDRAGGQPTNGTEYFMTALRAMTNAKTGYLANRPALGAPIGITHPGEWLQYCAERHAEFVELGTQVHETKRKSRQAHAEIRHITDLPNPMRYIRAALARMRDDIAVERPGSLLQASLGRNLAMATLLISNPLRARQQASLTWRNDGTGSLFRRDGGYGIYYPAAAFKNERGARKDKPYSMMLSKMAADAMHDYLTVYRPVLLANKAAKSDLVFLSSRPSKATTVYPWGNYNKAVEDITKHYLGNHFGPHLFRNLMATIYLTQNANEFITVSHVLHDTMTTVMNAYAHLEVGAGFAKYNQALETMA
jgi:hypothetical protein